MDVVAAAASSDTGIWIALGLDHFCTFLFKTFKLPICKRTLIAQSSVPEARQIWSVLVSRLGRHRGSSTKEPTWSNVLSNPNRSSRGAFWFLLVTSSSIWYQSRRADSRRNQSGSLALSFSTRRMIETIYRYIHNTKSNGVPMFFCPTARVGKMFAILSIPLPILQAMLASPCRLRLQVANRFLSDDELFVELKIPTRKAVGGVQPPSLLENSWRITLLIILLAATATAKKFASPCNCNKTTMIATDAR